MLLKRPTVFASLTIALLASLSACADSPFGQQMEQSLAPDPQLQDNQTDGQQGADSDSPNESPGELLRNFRLKRAAHLLSKKTDTVTQIAYQVGFNNLSYFTKSFKELFGNQAFLCQNLEKSVSSSPFVAECHQCELL